MGQSYRRAREHATCENCFIPCSSCRENSESVKILISYRADNTHDSQITMLAAAVSVRLKKKEEENVGQPDGESCKSKAITLMSGLSQLFV